MTYSEKNDICGLVLCLDIRCVYVSALISVRKFCIEIQSYAAVNFHEEICQDKKHEDENDVSAVYRIYKRKRKSFQL